MWAVSLILRVRILRRVGLPERPARGKDVEKGVRRGQEER